jgi:hypothetical protein
MVDANEIGWPEAARPVEHGGDDARLNYENRRDYEGLSCHRLIARREAGKLAIFAQVDPEHPVPAGAWLDYKLESDGDKDISGTSDTLQATLDIDQTKVNFQTFVEGSIKWRLTNYKGTKIREESKSCLPQLIKNRDIAFTWPNANGTDEMVRLTTWAES